MFKKISFSFVLFMIYMSVYVFATPLTISENFNIESFVNLYNQEAIASRKITNYELKKINGETYYVCYQDDPTISLMLKIENNNLVSINGIFPYESNGDSIALLITAKFFGLDKKISFGEYWNNVVNSHNSGNEQILWKEDKNIVWAVFSKPLSKDSFFVLIQRCD